MKLFQASINMEVIEGYHNRNPQELLDVLLSLAYNDYQRWSILVDCRHMINEVICDPGAFSVAQGSSSLGLDAVIGMLKILAPKFDRVFNFDDDFSTSGFEHNHENLTAMEEAGLNPIPVIHNFFNHEIDFYVSRGKHEWLALGSSQSTEFDNVRYAVHRIKKADQNMKIHWFGGSKYDWLIKLPIAACDTTSWAKRAEFGQLMYWNPHRDEAHKIYVGGFMKEMKETQFHFVTYPWRRDLEEYLDRTLSISFNDFLGSRGAFFLQLANTHFYAELAKRINEERVKLGVPLE